MNEKIDRIIAVASDYHKPLTIESVTHWINQFDEVDREFILDETLHILEQTYLSKDQAANNLRVMLSKLCTKYGFSTVEDFLENVTFLKCQNEYKSQSVLLDMLNNITNSEYGMNISINELDENKYWIYLDDNLATGGTFFNNINDTLDKFSYTRFKNDQKKIYACYFFIHGWGLDNTRFRLFKKYDVYIKNAISYGQFNKIDNNPRIHWNHNPSPMFNCAYIKNDSDYTRPIDYLNNLPIKLEYEKMSHKILAFRQEDKPDKEDFFSSNTDRDRYEHIILDKGLDILEKVGDPGKSTRPLGFINPTYQTLGMGSFVFTWRNISNTCPIVFWWEANAWKPLFSVANRGL